MSERGLASQRKDVKWVESSTMGEFNPNYSGGKYIDDKGYVRVLAPEHPSSIRGYIYEHRAVMEEYLNRFLNPWESVHHINEVKCDNRVENLFLCTSGEHSAIHREGKKPSESHKEKLRANMRQRNKLMKKDLPRLQGQIQKKGTKDP
jgi:hypothetical protein